MTDVNFTINNVEHTHKFAILDMITQDIILGNDFLGNDTLINLRNNTIDFNGQPVDTWIPAKFRPLRINFKADAKPIYCRPYKYSPDGSKRFCVDYKRLNKQVVRDHYPLPIIKDIVNKLKNCKYFSKIDCEKGYWQQRVDKDSKKYTTFITEDGIYEWNVVPMGFTNSSHEFQRCVDEILSNDRHCCSTFQDDILVYSEDFETHMKHLQKICQVLKSNNVKPNLKKCQFAQNTIKYCGYIISHNKVEADSERTSIFKHMDRPKNVRQLQSLLGLANYFREFIPGYSNISGPLTKLTSNKIKWSWTEEHESSFHKLLDGIRNMNGLVMPNYEAPFHIYTDASKNAAGFCIGQVVEGEFRPIAFGGKSFNTRGHNRSIHRPSSMETKGNQNGPIRTNCQMVARVTKRK
jgi:hypothetical protein